MPLNKNIILVGMPGSGKTTIGQLISVKLNMEYVDTDDLIEENAGVEIAQIFETNGEPYFRELETQAAKEIANLQNKVIATGGGMILKDENMSFLKENGVVFFLDRPIDNIFFDVDEEIRPLLKDNRNHLYNLYKERYPLYNSKCDFKIINDGSIETIVEKIESIWRSLGEDNESINN